MEDLIIVISPQSELPKINKILQVETVLGGVNKMFKVKKIVELRWNKYNEIVIELKGSYVK